MFTKEEIMSLNELESFVWEYVNENMEQVTSMTIRQLASEVHVSTTAILRVCKRFGCNGFSEFKNNLKNHIENVKVINYKSDKEIASKFMDMLESNKYRELFKKSIKLMLEKEHLLFLGKGMSNIAASYGSAYFNGNCKVTTLINDLSSLKSYDVLKDSVTVVLSVSGESNEVISKVEEIKKEGGSIISITNNTTCKLAKISDVNIPYYLEYWLPKNRRNNTQIIPMYIIEKLSVKYLELLKSKNNIEK